MLGLNQRAQLQILAMFDLFDLILYVPSTLFK